MNQSTIYRRHEARLARSYALRDDPRPAFIRVMSGLPGFRIIVPPYKQETKNEVETLNERKQGQGINALKTAMGAYSEETLFGPYSDNADNAVGSTSDRISGDAKKDFYSSAIEPTMQAMLATGVCSGITEYVFVYQNNIGMAKRAVRNSNLNGPLTMATPNTAHQSSFFSRQEQFTTSYVGGFGAHNRSAREIPNSKTSPSTATKTRPAAVALSKAMTASFSTSLLFGTKVFLESSMTNEQLKNDDNYYNSQLATKSFLSSAVAGGMVGLSQLALLQLQRRQPQSQPSPLSIIQQQYLTNDYSVKLIGRNVIAAILYFSIYEGVSSFSSTIAVLGSQSKDYSSVGNVGGGKETLSIVAGGALAGIAHVAAMNYHRYAHFGSTIWWSRVMASGASRAVPIHVLTFYGYEKIKESVKAAHS